VITRRASSPFLLRDRDRDRGYGPPLGRGKLVKWSFSVVDEVDLFFLFPSPVEFEVMVVFFASRRSRYRRTRFPAGGVLLLLLSLLPQ